MKRTTTHLAHATRTVLAVTAMVLGVIGLLIPILPGIPLLMIAVWLLATEGESHPPGILRDLRLAALRLARAFVKTLDALTRSVSRRPR